MPTLAERQIEPRLVRTYDLGDLCVRVAPAPSLILNLTLTLTLTLTVTVTLNPAPT